VNSHSFWIKGNRDDYAHFLAQAHNADLIKVSAGFRFEIHSQETSSLVLRRVAVWGECSNVYLLQDAFVGMMIAYPGSSFSTLANDNLVPCDHHRIYWHLDWHEPAYNCHHDSRILYFRFETARFLRELSLAQLGIAEIKALDGQEVPTDLIRLVERFTVKLNQLSGSQDQEICADCFLKYLLVELQLMCRIKNRNANAAAKAHVAESIQWLIHHASNAITLGQLAQAIHVNSRSIQVSFQRQFGITPMRWLKLWRISQLHRQLFHGDARCQTTNQLIRDSRLGSVNAVARLYRSIYGSTPQEQLNQVILSRESADEKLACTEKLLESGNRIYSIDDAIVLLSDLKRSPAVAGAQNHVIQLTVMLDA